MIVSKTPLRVSLVGGGTDLPAYTKHDVGCVVSLTIQQYVTVIVHRRWEKDTRLVYSKAELVESADKIEHEIIRECFNYCNIAESLDVITLSDVPSGAGMGSSSAVTVGLLAALHAHCGEDRTPRQLAEEACQIEIDRLRKPIGKQDQYAAAFGGANWLHFYCNGDVGVGRRELRPRFARLLEEWALLFLVGQGRSADTILARQSASTPEQLPTLRQMARQAQRVGQHITAWDEVAGIVSLGSELHKGWELKRSLGCGISNTFIDDIYFEARNFGVYGGKLLGAGGTGAMFLIAPPEKHATIKSFFKFQPIPFRLAPSGCGFMRL